MVRCGWDMSSPANKLESSGILNYRLIDRFGKARFASIKTAFCKRALFRFQQKPLSENPLFSFYKKTPLGGKIEFFFIPVTPLHPAFFPPPPCWCKERP